MIWLTMIYWGCGFFVVYTYLLYPLLVAILARCRRRPTRARDAFPGSVSIVVAAYNEEATIGRRLEELTDLLKASGLRGEVVVVSDGSTDRTAGIARSSNKGAVRVIELADNVGKASALSMGCAAARNEIIVFADARQTWASDSLHLLLQNFTDPDVGAVSGNLVVETSPGVMAGVGLYWRYEKWLRRQESSVHSTIGVTGAISAVRRSLFPPIPPRTLLDDVYWPLLVVMQGYRVVHERRAIAYDRLPDRPGDEFRRKVRTLAGNYQLLIRLPAALMPWRNPIWLQFVSHKLCRLLVPWSLLCLLIVGGFLADPISRLSFWAQIGFYLAGLVGIWGGARMRFRPACAAASFLVLNTAAWCAFWVWVTGRAGTSWRKVFYPSPAGGGLLRASLTRGGEAAMFAIAARPLAAAAEGSSGPGPRSS
jgi:poly-beta-1,6-N-acetyl-D-glucosamine synthase